MDTVNARTRAPQRGSFEHLTLRTELSLVLSTLLVLSIGLAGGTAIYQSARNMRRELTTEHQLFAENRAFALRDNFEILEDELKRLSLLPDMNFGDNNSLPEQQILSDAHQNSVLYNTAVLLLSADGTCLRSVPDRPEYRGQNFGERKWFRLAGAGRDEPVIRASEEPGIGRTIKIVQPIYRDNKFVGALMGMIALGEANLIIPALQENLPRDTDAMLVDDTGQIIYPADRALAAPGSDSETALRAAASGIAGTMTGEAEGRESLFAYAPVRAATNFALVFARPWSTLNANLRQQVWTLGGILLFGFILATTVGLALAAYLTGPLHALGESATRIARGEHVTSVRPPYPGRAEEVLALVAAFEHMEKSIQKRDQDLREAAAQLENRVAERTRELVATQQALVEAERFAAMGKTAAAIAHEIKNTLNGLGMAVELILEDPSNPRAARLHHQVVGEVARLRDVVDSLLSFSRSPRITLERVDLMALIRDALDLLADLIADRGATVRVDAPIELLVLCDGHKIKGVIVNLVKNAVEAGRVVRVSARVQDGDAVLEVADDGPGLSEHARLHLFEPFFTTKPNGVGLGLVTSQRYLEAHGGRIEGDVAPDLGGAVFRVRVPRVVIEGAEPAFGRSHAEGGKS